MQAAGYTFIPGQVLLRVTNKRERFTGKGYSPIDHNPY